MQEVSLEEERPVIQVKENKAQTRVTAMEMVFKKKKRYIWKVKQTAFNNRQHTTCGLEKGRSEG